MKKAKDAQEEAHVHQEKRIPRNFLDVNIHLLKHLFSYIRSFDFPF